MSSDALTPLRHVYGVAAPAAPGADASGVEAETLRQSRALLDGAAAASDRRPSEAVLAAVRTAAADASACSLGPLAAVRALAGEPVDGPVPAAEAALLRQSADLLDAARAARPQRPDAAVLAAVLARAAAASADAAPADVRVADGPLAPLAAAYGHLAADAPAPSGVETALLGQMRALLDDAPRSGPDAGAVAAVLAAAAAATPTPAPSPVATPLAPVRPPVAADRLARPSTPARRRAPGTFWRVGAVAGALVLAALAWMALPARTTGGPAGPAVALTAPVVVDDAPVVASVVPETVVPDPVGAFVAPVSPPLPELAVAAVPRPRAPRAETAPVPSAAPAAFASPPVQTRLATVAADAPPADAASWDAPDEVRVISLRLQELRRAGEGLTWEGPEEAFGAPAARTTSADPGVRTVRETLPVGRARVLAAPPDNR